MTKVLHLSNHELYLKALEKPSKWTLNFEYFVCISKVIIELHTQISSYSYLSSLPKLNMKKMDVK